MVTRAVLIEYMRERLTDEDPEWIAFCATARKGRTRRSSVRRH
jgi:hypothetical protein